MSLHWLVHVHNGERAPSWASNSEFEARVHRLYGAIQEAWQAEHGVEA